MKYIIRADKPLRELDELLHKHLQYSDEKPDEVVNAVLQMGTTIIELAKEGRRFSDKDICD